MDFETKEMLRVVGRLITDLSPGSIQDLGRKTEALSILRGIVQTKRTLAAEPVYPRIVVETWERVHNVLAGVTDKGVSALDIIAELYAIGQKEGAAREYYRDTKTQAAEKDVCRSQEIPPSTKGMDDAAAYSILGARAAGGLRASREHVDDIEFFRNGGI